MVTMFRALNACVTYVIKSSNTIFLLQHLAVNHNDGDSLLHIACQWGDVDIVKYLITVERCNLNAPSSTFENTPLHVAVKCGHTDTVLQLLSYNECNPNIHNNDGDTPLHFAAKYGQDDIIVQLLFCAKCIPHAQNKDGDTPLHYAIRHSKTAAISRLLAHQQCKVNFQNKVGDTSLHCAVRYAQDNTIVQLLSCKECELNVTNKDGDTPLHVAVEQNRIAVISKLLAHQHFNVNIQNKEGDTSLHVAVRQNKTVAACQLLSHQQCDINVQNKVGNTPLHIAVKNLGGNGCSSTLVDLLSCKKCDLNVHNKEGDTPLHIAVRQNETDVISKLLAHQQCDVDVQNKVGDTPLHIAIKVNKITSVSQILAAKKCDPNIQNADTETPLHIAVKQVQDEIVIQLLSCGECDSNVKNRDGDTPLHIACQHKSLNIVKLFLEQKCSTNTTNKKGETAQYITLDESGNCLLHIACQWDDLDIASYLIAEQRCNPNIQNHYLNTPLHIACYVNSLRVIRFLLEMRCSTNILNKIGETAQDIPLNDDEDCLLHVACQWGDVDIVRYLITDGSCNPTVQTSISESASLHIAATYGQDSTSGQLLLCNPNVKNKKGDTPLHVACYRKSLYIIKLLLEWKCSTSIPNKKGETPQDIPLNEDGDCLLHIACQWGDVDIVRYLITDERCDCNIQNMNLNTALHIMCYQRSLHIVRFLLELNCSINIPNVKGETAQDIPLNEDGDCLLHIACQWGDVGIITFLITDQMCNLNIQNTHLNTALHLACYVKSLSVIRLLLEMKCSTNIPNKKSETAQDIPLNEDGDCLLHIACQWGDVGIVKYLINDERCDPNIESSISENTPLHISAEYGQDDAIVQLLSNKECNPNAQNKVSDTPLHLAVRESKTAAISQLLAHQQCNPNIQNKKGDTPLHIACYKKSLDIIKLLLERKCKTNIPNNRGEIAQDIPLNEDGGSLLHIACQWGNVDICRYLINDEKVYLNVQTSISENTPLHIATKYGQDDIIVKLLLNKECNSSVQNKEGDTALHIAVRGNTKTVISQLLANVCCDVNIPNNDHLTPLLTAIEYNNYIAATALLQHKNCDPTVCDLHGNTPLHLACRVGEAHPEMVQVAKRLLISVDPLHVNNAGQTAIELTTNYQLIQAISHIVKCKTKQSVQTYINMFIVGNPETGKSTLVKAICKEATSFLWKIVPKQLRRVKNVSPHTAGIIPTKFQSKIFGNTILYDLAGQIEYYSSHGAVIKSTVISTPPAFIIVVNLSESKERISETMRYWWSFINNHASQSSTPPEVILVGSHADVVKSTGGSVQEKMTFMSDLLKRLPVLFHFVGEVAIDCRDPAAKGLRLFCSLVNQSCTALRQTADVDLHCHVLYAFLKERFKGNVACTVSNVAVSIKENSTLLPYNLDNLIPLISTLSDKGLLLLVKGSESRGDWWVILEKQTLLGEINGAIFAPKNFKQYKDLSWNTGVVPFNKLKNAFRNDDLNMVCEFLIHLEFCFKIEDHETLELLKDEAEDMSSNVSEAYYFFPALVSVENPLHIWEQDDAMCCKCGWFYQCIRHDQFLTTQFLHVIILRLAFTFALRLDPGDCREDSLFLRRKCSVWKHGIGWLNWVPIETVVEVGLQHQSVIVMMRCPKGEKAKCVQLRSEVIQKILSAKDEHCKAVEMSESFIHPMDVKYPISDINGDVRCYSLTGVARMINKGATNVLDQRGRNPLSVQDLLLVDPYNNDMLLGELFSEKHSMDEKVRSQVLETLNSESEEL